MSHILAEWINTEVGLSQPVAAEDLDSCFRSGFLFGELLHKLQIQDHLAPYYVNAPNVDALVRNFTSLEVTLKQKLGIKLSSNYAIDIINGKRGAAAKLLYQIKSAAVPVASVAAAVHGDSALPPIAADGRAKTRRPKVAAAGGVGGVSPQVAGSESASSARPASAPRGRPPSGLASYPATPVAGRPAPAAPAGDARHTYNAKEVEFFAGMLKAKLKRFNPIPPALPGAATAAKPGQAAPMAGASAGVARANTRKPGASTKQPDARDAVNASAPAATHAHTGKAPHGKQALQLQAAGIRHESTPSRESESWADDKHDVSEPTMQQLKMQRREAQAQIRRREIINSLGRDIGAFETKLELAAHSGPADASDDERNQDEDNAAGDGGGDGGGGLSAANAAAAAERAAPRQADTATIEFIRTKARMSPVQHMKQLARLVPAQDAKQEQSRHYLDKIRVQRVEEEYSRKDREQRRRKIILSHQQAQQEMEKKHLEELVLSKLMRQSKQERRIAEQLMQVRHEKEVMHENRVFREQQYAERRQKDFEDAIAREFELCEQARREYLEQMAQQLEQHREILAAKRTAKHAKNTTFCAGLVGEIVDLVFKVAEYRELNDSKDVPRTKMREWKTLFVAGESVNKPVIVDIKSERLVGQPPDAAVGAAVSDADGAGAAGQGASSTDPQRDEGRGGEDTSALKLLDDAEFGDYIGGRALWAVPGQDMATNPILGSIVDDIMTLTAPPEATYEVTPLPSAPLRIVIIGKRFSGKSTLAKAIADTYNMSILRIDDLMKEAISESDPAPKKAASDAKDKDAKDKDKAAKKPLTKQQIGAKIQLVMLEGQSPDDSLLVALVIEALSQQPTKAGGWVLVDFPRTRTQAQLLERELSGYEDPKPVKKGDLKRPKEKDKSASKNRSLIAPADVQGDAAAAVPASGLDCVLLLDVDNETAISRSAGQRIDPITGKIYHLELDPPPKNAPGTFERLAYVEDESKSRAQIQYQLAAFEEEEDPLKDWFNRFRILKTVDATHGPEKTAEIAQSIVNDIIETKEADKRERDNAARADDSASAAHVGDGADALSEAHGDDDKKDKQQAAPAAVAAASGAPATAAQPSSSGTQATPQQRVTSPGDGAAKNKSAGLAAPPGPAKPADIKRQATPSGVAGDQLAGDATAAPPPETQSEPAMHHVVRTVCTNGRRLPSKELAEVLVDQWTTIESTYTDTLKFTFRSLRREQEAIVRFFFDTKSAFKTFLERPDSKQDLVDTFQAEYNAIEDDLRCDPDAKAELHQRVEDLRDRLWEMSDHKREEAENERLSIIEDKWVEDHSYILINTYISMMQAELDRFLSSRQLIIDYYRDANNVPLADMHRPAVRIPAIAATAPPPVEIATVLITAHEAQAAQRREGAQSANAGGPSAAGQAKAAAKPAGAAPAAPAPTKDKDAAKKGAAAGAKAAAAPAGPAAAPAPSSVEQPVRHMTFFVPEKEHIVIDHDNVHFPDIQAAFDFCMANLQIPDHALDFPVAPSTPNGDRRSKLRSSEGGEPRDDAEQPQQPEHIRAVELEEQVVRFRLERIRQHAIDHLKELRSKGFEAFILLDDWIGARFQAEMDAAKDMVNLIKEAIESEAKLPNQLLLDGEKFQIDFGQLTFEPEPEPRPESPVEKILPDQFTVLQLLNLGRQLRLLAPSGRISTRSFFDCIQRAAALSAATDMLPENYCNADPQQFQQLCCILDPFETGFVCWRKYLMLNARILPAPLSAIIDMRAQFERLAGGVRAKITRGEYDQVYLWFDGDCAAKFDDSQLRPFDRAAKMRAALFVIFSEPSPETQQGAAGGTALPGGTSSSSADPIGTQAMPATSGLVDPAVLAQSPPAAAGAAVAATPPPQGPTSASASAVGGGGGSGSAPLTAAAAQSQAAIAGGGGADASGTDAAAGPPSAPAGGVQSGIASNTSSAPGTADRHDARAPEPIVLGEHDPLPADGSLFDVLEFLACAALDESAAGGLEKAFHVFGGADGACTAQNVSDALHHFLVLAESSHRLEAGDSVEDPYPMDVVQRVFDEAKVPRGGTITFEAFAAACDAVAPTLAASPLMQMEDLTISGARSRPSSGLDPGKGGKPAP